MFLYLLNISVPFHLVYISVFGVTFLYAGSLWFLSIVEVPSCGWVWLVKVSWLGKLVSVFWWAEMYFFSLECNGVFSNEFCDGSMC